MGRLGRDDYRDERDTDGRTETEAAVDAGITIAAREHIESDVSAGVLSVVLQPGAKHETVDLERLVAPYRTAPKRATGTVRLHTVGAFVRYVERHDVENTTTLWVDADDRKVVAVFNDDTPADSQAHPGDPGWGDNRAELTLKLSDAWKHWTKRDNTLMSQAEFAEHVEDGLEDIVTPSSADMLEIAQSIQGYRSATFKSAGRLSNGTVGVQWIEEQTAKAGQKGDLEIPERFELGLAPFVGEDAYRVGARLRWRINGGNLTLGYRLDRPEDVLRAAVDGIADRLGQQFTLDRVFVGVPR